MRSATSKGIPKKKNASLLHRMPYPGNREETNINNKIFSDEAYLTTGVVAQFLRRAAHCPCPPPPVLGIHGLNHILHGRYGTLICKQIAW